MELACLLYPQAGKKVLPFYHRGVQEQSPITLLLPNPPGLPTEYKQINIYSIMIHAQIPYFGQFAQLSNRRLTSLV